MEKSKLEKFIAKYNLGGSCESVLWKSDGTDITVKCISDDKNVLGLVTVKDAKLDEGDYGIFDTKQLSSMLSVLGDGVDFAIQDIEGKAVSLKFNDKSTSVNYMLADLSVIPNVPDLKQLPQFNVEIKLDSNFISKFIKAKGALDENNFTFVCKDGKGQIVLGHSNINTNRISIDVDCTCDGDVNPISFSATYLKEILVANKEATDATLKISSQGLSHIRFEIDNYESNYYLVEIQS